MRIIIVLLIVFLTCQIHIIKAYRGNREQVDSDDDEDQYSGKAVSKTSEYADNRRVSNRKTKHRVDTDSVERDEELKPRRKNGDRRRPNCDCNCNCFGARASIPGTVDQYPIYSEAANTRKKSRPVSTRVSTIVRDSDEEKPPTTRKPETSAPTRVEDTFLIAANTKKKPGRPDPGPDAGENQSSTSVSYGSKGTRNGEKSVPIRDEDQYSKYSAADNNNKKTRPASGRGSSVDPLFLDSVEDQRSTRVSDGFKGARKPEKSVPTRDGDTFLQATNGKMRPGSPFSTRESSIVPDAGEDQFSTSASYGSKGARNGEKNVPSRDEQVSSTFFAAADHTKKKDDRVQKFTKIDSTSGSREWS